ncbi:TFIIE beta subunit core domain-containing protein [Dipodascopsis tothii]|uniref:TFIIE beta subunit core domain-containing protein n=1 Tax=Dipodascopsis tothii TaxID=44089 RepID=UPI0034CF562C
MSSLADEMSAFKNRLKAAPVLQRRTISASAPGSPGADRRERKKKRSTLVYSQPADTGIGNHALTQLHHAVEYIKGKDRPVSVDDLSSFLSHNATPMLLAQLQRIDRINYDAAANTYEYRPLHNIRSKEALLLFLRRQPTAHGLPVKELKDGWSGYMDAIDELEQSGDIMVLRTKKEGTPRLVWANAGGDIGGVDIEYVNAWHRIAIPAAPDLPAALDEVGLKPTSVDPATVKKATKPVERKQKKPRRGKITNTHITGVLKDFGRR